MCAALQALYHAHLGDGPVEDDVTLVVAGKNCMSEGWFSAEPAPPPERVLAQDTVLSRMDAKEALIDRYQAAMHETGFYPGKKCRGGYCVEELFTNAMLHGNEGDPSLPVHVCFGVTGEMWSLTVTDVGTGFGPDALPQDDDTMLVREHGRGVLLVRQWADELIYFDSGRTACVRRRCQPPQGISVMPADFVNIATYDRIVVVTISRDRLTDVASITAIDNDLQAQLDRHPRISLLLDISKVSAMSSQMLGKLVAIHKAVKKGKGRFAISGAQPGIMPLFTVTKLHKVLDLQPDGQKILMLWRRKPL